MGTFLFKWPHAASEVFVTGTFDNWSKSNQLTKEGDVFQKLVDIPNADEKIYYKFVVDGTWTTDHEAATENDDRGIPNNVLLPSDITKSSAAESSATGISGLVASILPSMNSGSSTVPLAGAQPLEKGRDLDSAAVPGAFPETPSGDQTVAVNPIPATSGLGNPVTLAPGEKVPDSSTLTDNTVNSTARTDQASYESSAPLATTAAAGAASAAASSGVASSTVIPEAGIVTQKTAVDDVPTALTSTVGPGATTADLAGQQPILPRQEAKVVDNNELSPSDIKPTTEGATTPKIMDANTAAAIGFANNSTGPGPEPASTTVQPSTGAESATADEALRKDVTANPDEPPRVPGPAHRQEDEEREGRAETQAPAPKLADSRDVSPMSRQPTAGHPMADTVIPTKETPKPTPAAAAAPAPAPSKPEAAPSSAKPATASAPKPAPAASKPAPTASTPSKTQTAAEREAEKADKKKKRSSFFSKIKQALK